MHVKSDARWMDHLFSRGRAAYLDFLKKEIITEPPLGIESTCLVTYRDFIVHVEECYEYVRVHRKSILILDHNGEAEMLMCRHRIPRVHKPNG